MVEFEANQVESWQEVTPGTFERDLDEHELFYAAAVQEYARAKGSFWAINAHIGLSIDLEEGEQASGIGDKFDIALRKAWTTLRYHHPGIAVVMRYDASRKRCRNVYRTLSVTPDSADLSDWLERSLRTVDEIQRTGVEFSNTNPPLQEESTLYVVKPPDSQGSNGQSTVRRDLVFRCNHAIVDGIGSLMLFDELLAHAGSAFEAGDAYTLPLFGDEAKNLAPPFRIAARLPKATDPRVQQKFDGLKDHAMAARDHPSLAAIPYEPEAQAPNNSQRVALDFTKEETDEILRACKTLQISATHAFHAGIIIAIRGLQKRSTDARSVRYLNYCLINLRPHMPPPFNSPKYATAIYHSSSERALVVDMTIPAATPTNDEGVELNSQSVEADFLDIVNQVKDFYVLTRNDPDHLAMAPILYDFLTETYPEVPPEIPPPDQNPSVSISSFGLIDRIVKPRHGRVKAADPWVIGEELTNGVGCFLGTWEGEICLSAAFNDAWHTEKGIMDFLGEVKRIVFAGLKVKAS